MNAIAASSTSIPIVNSGATAFKLGEDAANTDTFFEVAALALRGAFGALTEVLWFDIGLDEVFHVRV